MNNKNILVSVLIPAYNAEKYIAFCLNSLIAQTHKALEIIVVNDGSTDNTGKICDEFAAKDSRIRVIHQENKGVSCTRNVALDLMNGEYVIMVDADDFIEPQTIEILLQNCIDFNSEIIIYDSIDTSTQSFVAHEITNNVKTYDALFLLQNIAYLLNRESSCTRFFHKSIFDDLRFPIGLRYEDSFIAYSTIEKAKKVSFTDAKLYYYYLSPNSFMRSNFSEKSFDIFESYEQKLKVLKRNKCDDSLNRIQANYAYCIVRIIGMTKYSPNFSKDFKKKKISELKKKYRELSSANKDNPYFKGRIKAISTLLYYFPIIKKFRNTQE